MSPLLGDEDHRDMLDFIKQQLRDGKRVPWLYREYGAIAVNEMFKDHDPIKTYKRNATAMDLKDPSAEDLANYDLEVSKLWPDENNTPTKRKRQCKFIACWFSFH